MNIKYLTLIAIFLLSSLGINAQKGFCLLEDSPPNFLANLPHNKVQAAASYQLNVFTHALRQDAGTGGITAAELATGLALLEADLAPHNICIHVIGGDNINNTAYYNNWSSNFDDIVATNAHANAIDIYFAPNTASAGGKADGIPASALVLGGTWSDGTIINTSHVLSHEFGHCIGLYHTHHGTINECCGDPAQCAELVDGSNCSTCGDYVCDTAADPHIQFNVNAACQWQGSGNDANGDPYAPDEENIMAYTQPTCMDYYSSGQGQRARDMIANAAVLQAVVAGSCTSCDDLVLTGTINNTQDYQGLTINSTQVLTSSADVTYQAENSITLNPGFRVQLGGTLVAEIDDCIGSLTTKKDNNTPIFQENELALRDVTGNSESGLFCYPNPFSDITTIEYQLDADSPVTLSVYDLNGRLISELDNSSKVKGLHQVRFDASDMAPGIYLARLVTGEQILTTKLVVK